MHRPITLPVFSLTGLCVLLVKEWVTRQDKVTRVIFPLHLLHILESVHVGLPKTRGLTCFSDSFRHSLALAREAVWMQFPPTAELLRMRRRYWFELVRCVTQQLSPSAKDFTVHTGIVMPQPLETMDATCMRCFFSTQISKTAYYCNWCVETWTLFPPPDVSWS